MYSSSFRLFLDFFLSLLGSSLPKQGKSLFFSCQNVSCWYNKDVQHRLAGFHLFKLPLAWAETSSAQVFYCQFTRQLAVEIANSLTPEVEDFASAEVAHFPSLAPVHAALALALMP